MSVHFQEDFLAALEHSVILSITNREGTILHVNDRFCDLSGYTRDELMGNTFRMLKSDEHPSEFFNELWDTILGGQTWRGVIRNKKKDGTLYWVESTIIPISEPDKREVQSFISIFFDISAEQKLKEQLVAQQRAFHSSQLTSVSKMAISLAHEFATPLSVLQTSIGILEELILDHETKVENRQHHITKQIQYLNDTLFDLGELTILLKQLGRHSKNNKLLFETINIQGLSHTLHKLCISEFNRYSIAFTLSQKSCDTLFSNRVALIQILMNLIQNSIHAVRDQEKPWIRIEFTNQTKEVAINVTDSGTGIPQSVVENMFDSFFSTKDLSEGSGVGLSFVKHLVGILGGEISYLPIDGHTNFCIQLPNKEMKNA